MIKSSHIVRTLSLVFSVAMLSFGCESSDPLGLPERDMEVGPDGGLGTVQITSPSDDAVLSGTDDLDGDLSNGLQTKIVVVVSRPTVDVELEVAGQMSMTSTSMNGRAEFDVTLPADQNGDYRVTARIVDEAGIAVEDSLVISVRTGQCEVRVFPQPRGAGCDLGADADEDPGVAGLQTTLRAETNCDNVSFIINNLPAISVSAVDGAAEAQVTLRDGSNTVTVSATDGIVDPVIIGPYPLEVRTSAPRITMNGLSDTRVNTFLLADGETQAGSVYWTLAGTAQGIEPGATVEITMEPPLPGAPSQSTVDAQGNINLELSTASATGYYRGTITLAGVDSCGVRTEDNPIEIILDAVSPSLTIESPADDEFLVFSQDVDPLRAGAQIPVTISQIDPRPASAEYQITVECAAVGGGSNFVNRARQPSDVLSRSALLDMDPDNDIVIVTFQQSERGEFVCRPAILGEGNPVVPNEVLYRAFFDRPSLGLISPSPAPACISAADIEIVGLGESLDGNSPEINVVVTPENGAPGLPRLLLPLGNDRYGITFGPDQFPDGNYNLAVSGTVLGGVPVVVEPAQMDIRVDRAPPSLEFLGFGQPAEFVDVEPASPGTQAQLSLQVCGLAGQQLTVTSEPLLPNFPVQIEVAEGEGDCIQVTLDPVTVPLGAVTLSATAVDACGIAAETSVSASLPEGLVSAQITSPTDGDFVNVAADRDAATPGCQIEIEAIGQGLGEGATFQICTDVAQGALNDACQGRSSALSGDCRIVGATPNGSLIACPVSLQNGAHELSFVGLFGDRVESAIVNLNVDCQSPTVDAISFLEDADLNGCVHGQERLNQVDDAGAATVTVEVVTSGLEDGQEVSLRSDSDEVLGSAAVTAGVARVPVTLADGVRRLSASGSDAAGNPLPSAGPGFVEAEIQIDTVAPVPALLNIDAASCLNSVDDEADLDDLQFTLRASTGRQPGEEVVARFTVDGVVNGLAIESADSVEFAQVTMAQGERQIAITVTDQCGNVGSSNGFQILGDIPDWSDPIPTSVIVDTVPPNLALAGIDEGRVLVAEDDADGDSLNGFQVDVLASLLPFDGLEVGDEIGVEVNGVAATTSPNPITVPGNLAGPIPARVTLSPGAQAMRLSAIDQCGNSASSDVVNFQVDIQGCGSRIDSFPNNQVILGSAAGVIDQGDLLVDISGSVDLLDEACVGANVQLLIDGLPRAAQNVPANGRVTFPNVRLSEGSYNLSFSTGPVQGNTVVSPIQEVEVDLSAPVVQIVQPLADSAVLTDSNPGTAGQQANIRVSVSENQVVTSRSATIEIDGAVVGEPTDLDNGSPAVVNFLDVTLPAGERVLRVCVTDLASNQGCAQWSVNADPEAPAVLVDLTAQVIDPRSTEVALQFTGVGDDGVLGAVSGYRVRRSDAPINDETAWENAAITEVTFTPDAAAGEPESITLSGYGNGVTVADGLALNEEHFLAVRAVDDAGRLGEIASAQADLRMSQTIVSLPPNTPPWSDAPTFNLTSAVAGLGDVNADGFDDLLITTVKSATETLATVVFGVPDGEEARIVTLDVPAGMGADFFGVGGATIGDVNGDGAPDFSVLGFTPAFAGAAAIYFGCAAPCADDEIASPDVQITAPAGRLLGIVAAAGNFNQRAVDNGSTFGDFFLGGSISAASNHQTSYVIAGRDNWPAQIQLSDDAADAVDGVTIIQVPDSKCGQSAAGVGDQNGDGFGEIAFSAGNPNIAYVFQGGADVPGLMAYDFADPRTQVIADACSDDPNGFGSHFAGGVDLDGDANGRPDMLVGDGINRRINVFDHSAENIDCIGRSRSLFGSRFDIAGDIDGDGALDLIAGHSDDDTDAFIFYNDGLGRFGVGDLPSPRGYNVLLTDAGLPYQGVAGAGDFNGDGRDDFAVLVKQPGPGNIEVIIYQ